MTGNDSWRAPSECEGALRVLFAGRRDTIDRYAELLATEGVVRGLIGPREGSRLWQRHLLNCAVVAELVPDGATVIDVGSGAGLPGLVLAIARPDLRMVLVEPLLRRAEWLHEVVNELGLDTSVVRERAGESPRQADVVTARAVAELAKLAGWCLPLVRPGGELLAIKGSSAAEELTAARSRLRRLGAVTAEVVQCGKGLIDEPTTVVRVVRA